MDERIHAQVGYDRHGKTDVTQDFALILDDYHVITGAAIHKALAYLLDHLPPKMHLVLLTRSDPLLPLARPAERGVEGIQQRAI